MLVKIEARILIFPGTDFHFPSTSVPPGTFFRLCLRPQRGTATGADLSLWVGSLCGDIATCIARSCHGCIQLRDGCTWFSSSSSSGVGGEHGARQCSDVSDDVVSTTSYCVTRRGTVPAAHQMTRATRR